MNTRVLLIGIDGVRRDVLQRISPPHITALAAQGGFRALTIDTRGTTISGPMWSTLLTGTYPIDHWVYDNEHPPARRTADVWSQLVDAGSIQAPVAVASWPPLTSRVGCGPIIDPSRVRSFTAHMTAEDCTAYVSGDAQVRDVAVALLSDPATDGAFVYFGLADETAHQLGVSDAYEAAILACDTHVGEVLAALAARPDREQWIVAVTTDHGHIAAGGHGGQSPEECEIWLASDSQAFLSEVTAPHELAPAIARVYSRAGTPEF